MPPKPKYTKEEIVAAAVEVVAQKGVKALTAKELSAALGTSTSPIFTVFSTMQEVQEEVRRVAMRRFERFAAPTQNGEPAFKQIGLKMVLFGMQQPKLYRLLFMRENQKEISFDDMFGALGETATLSINAIEHDYGLAPDEAKMLFENVWVYTFGMGALCATKACSFTEKQLSDMLSTQFQAIMMLIRSRNRG